MAPAAPLWTPSPTRVRGTAMHAFLQRTGHADYPALHAWSVREPAAFWRELWDFCGVRGEMGERVLVDGDRLPGARWFPDARLSVAENLLWRRDDAPAIVLQREDGHRRQLSFAELADQVGRAQRAFHAAGLREGDRVAAFIPNIPEAIVAALAVASLGAIWSSASPDFGVQGVLDRFGQVEPRFLVVADGHLYKGQVFSSEEKLRGVLAGLPTVERVLVVRDTGGTDPSTIPGAEDFAAFLAAAPAGPPEFPRFPFAQPLYILFSSGTTGRPKCITHGAGGTLLQHLKEHRLHSDLRVDDRFFYFTTTGWMMWNWLVSGLATGATLVLYDGSPFHPRPQVLWDLAERERLTLFGTSAKFLDACKKVGLKPAETHDLSALRTLCSTGSPLVPESFDYVYEDIKADLQLASIAGGTDIVSCFMLGNPVLPVWRGEIQCRGLGMDVQVFGDDGRPVVGEPGELVCASPAPSMPVGFWGDDDGSRYRAAYFEHFPGVWRHGDLVELTEHGGVIVYGRSDATLNPGGVRIGTAEIYRQVEQIPSVEEAIVVGQEREGDQRVVLFVRLGEGLVLDDALRAEIRRRIRENTTPRHVPAVIAQVADIPRTRSGKISELAVREVIHGRPVKNTEALANPEALEFYRDRSELG
ncbi:MAG: acetoacetate--CoA ligase [Candidatus Krumholzibacteriia bacterium]|nr:acetoacetate--CoA ligase [Candidatus Latescibacterota bacterium]